MESLVKDRERSHRPGAQENGSVRRASWVPQKLKDRKSVAYLAMAVFTFLYYMRPQDVIPGLEVVPLEKIGGAIALLALIFGARPKDRHGLPLELKVLLALEAQMILSIPFAYWRGGAFDAVFTKFSKGIIVALLIGLIISKLYEIRRLLYIQAASVAFVAAASVAAHRTFGGRLWGIQKGILENPNDLAIAVAINFPLCVAFMFGARSGFRKALWAIGLVFMMYCVLLTYSRSGTIALVITVLICLWEYGVRQKRTLLLLGAGLFGVVALAVALMTPHFIPRMMSLTRGNIEGSGDHGSLEARETLLKQSISVALHHPLFGVGPGNFPVVTGEWRVAHNSYTELAAEAGFPALFLFLLLLFTSFRKVNRIRKLPGYAADENIRLWTSALWASLAAYAIGSMFASTEYNLFPYFMVGYVCALYRIASKPFETEVPATQGGRKAQVTFTNSRGSEYAWSR
ncbi:MAG TPA: O-antigen ligase family protein [Terriglobales bacterium]|nr:O-antigen ligase family protein [Terriglobales bacterium]